MKDSKDEGRDRKRSQENEKTSGKKKQSSSNNNNQTTSKKSHSNTASGNNVNSDEDDDEDESDAEDEKDDVSRALFFYADEIITSGLTVRGQEIELLKALKAVEKCIFLFLNDNPLLQKMLKKASTRDMSDNKVPPGSASVQRKMNDDRFILSLACINKGKVQAIIQEDANAAIQSYRDALVFYPKSAEANESLAQLLRVQADTQSKLNLVEILLRKASSSIDQIKEGISTVTVEMTRMTSLNSASSSGKSGKSGNGFDMSVGGDDEESDNDDDGDDDGMFELEVDLGFLNRELKATNRAVETLSLFLCQEGNNEEASIMLKKGGFTTRLSKEVLNYIQEDEEIQSSKGSIDSGKYLQVTDNILSPPLLAHMQEVFRPSSPFWSEHHYDAIANSSRTAGYFSYLYHLKERKAGNSIEQVIDCLFEKVKQMFPQAAEECNHAEWWVHTRPHSSGHQLHFDSDDEGLTREGGKPVHPICSTVLYLDEGVGGPTIITDQLLGGKLAQNGWICFPKTNRLVLFDARYLHGVVPGRGVNPDPTKRRLTLMVGFWRKIEARQRDRDVAGPGQPFPDKNSRYSWHKEMEKRPIGEARGAVEVQKRVAPQPISKVW
eukprot:CAMPEP_0119037214 /NCGR_PEP_ID=MMETSP1177-20130426/5419_1 /TAXON_ID=2985 /ORGANISM="Ochromonas sp, Strain CCMP1899" /LENGTH=607 /DNA_ID=CAMNT_0006998151 /DNA_START=90 /DNA_END=1910 /DNA_ORIENTATION=+